MSRSRDYAYEALAEVTNADASANRGELNVALKTIREQAPELDSYLLSAEIHERAKMYRQLMGEALLTPTALAKHWKRVFEEVRIRKPSGTNLTAEVSEPLPKKQDPPEWAKVWWFARHIRDPRNLIPLPQQKGYTDDALTMSEAEYQALRKEWVAAGCPSFSVQALITAMAKRDYASEAVQVLKEIAE